MQGYRLMADEAADQWDGAPPTHVFIQGGVGGVAAAVSVQMRARFQPRAGADRGGARPRGLPAGERRTRGADDGPGRSGHADGRPRLRRAEPRRLAGAGSRRRPRSWRSRTRRRWPACGCSPTGASSPANRVSLASPAACWLPPILRPREALGLVASSRVLAFNTEGATDPALYRTSGGSPGRTGVARSSSHSATEVTTRRLCHALTDVSGLKRL